MWLLWQHRYFLLEKKYLEEVIRGIDIWWSAFSARVNLPRWSIVVDSLCPIYLHADLELRATYSASKSQRCLAPRQALRTRQSWGGGGSFWHDTETYKAKDAVDPPRYVSDERFFLFFPYPIQFFRISLSTGKSTVTSRQRRGRRRFGTKMQNILRPFVSAIQPSLPQTRVKR